MAEIVCFVAKILKLTVPVLPKRTVGMNSINLIEL